MYNIPLSGTSSPCNPLFLNLGVYGLVQATVGVGTILVGTVAQLLQGRGGSASLYGFQWQLLKSASCILGAHFPHEWFFPDVPRNAVAAHNAMPPRTSHDEHLCLRQTSLDAIRKRRSDENEGGGKPDAEQDEGSLPGCKRLQLQGKALACSTWGDPHVVTFAGRNSHPMGQGEFVLAAVADQFRVHACFQPVPWDPSLSVNTAFAIESKAVKGAVARGQGRIRREGTSVAAPAAVRQAVGGGCQSGWGRLLSVMNAVEAGTWRWGGGGGGQWLGVGWAPWRGGTSPPSNASLPGGLREVGAVVDVRLQLDPARGLIREGH